MNLSRFMTVILLLILFLASAGLWGRNVSPSDGKPGTSVTLAAVGDLMMGGRVLPLMERLGTDYPFDSTRSFLREADIALANLEAPFTMEGEPCDKTFVFRVQPNLAGALVSAGFDMLTLANNHILDFGPEGLFSTLETLDRLGISHCGAGIRRQEAERAAVVEMKGMRLAFLAFSMTYPESFWANDSRPGTAYPHPQRLIALIDSLNQCMDAVIVSFHWGGENRSKPRDYQVHFAHQAVDAGADLVIGHHPHVIQGVEWYQGAFIAYSLGNFIFGSYSRTCQGLMMKADLQGGKVRSVLMIPLDVNNYRVNFQPRPARGLEKTEIMDQLKELSAEFHVPQPVQKEEGLLFEGPDTRQGESSSHDGADIQGKNKKAHSGTGK